MARFAVCGGDIGQLSVAEVAQSLAIDGPVTDCEYDTVPDGVTILWDNTIYALTDHEFEELKQILSNTFFYPVHAERNGEVVDAPSAEALFPAAFAKNQDTDGYDFWVDDRGRLWRGDRGSNEYNMRWDPSANKWVNDDSYQEAMNAPAPTIAPPKPGTKPGQTPARPPAPVRHPNPFRRKTPNPAHKPAPEKAFLLQQQANQLAARVLSRYREAAGDEFGAPGSTLPPEPAEIPSREVINPGEYQEERNEMAIGRDLLSLAERNGGQGSWAQVDQLARELLAMHGQG